MTQKYPLSQVLDWLTAIPNEIPTTNEFLVGMTINLDPESGFNFIEGEYVYGYDVELAFLVANFLNRPLRIVNISFDQLIDVLQSGKVDMLSSQLNYTFYRSTRVAFSYTAPAEGTSNVAALLVSLYNIISSSIINQDIVSAVNNYALQINQILYIGAPSGTVQENYLLNLKRKGLISNLAIVLTDSTEEAITLMKTGTLALYLTDTPIARDDPSITNVTNRIILPEDFVGPYAVAFNIQCCAILEKVGNYLLELLNNGTLFQIGSSILSGNSDFQNIEAWNQIPRMIPSCVDTATRCRIGFPVRQQINNKQIVIISKKN